MLTNSCNEKPNSPSLKATTNTENSEQEENDTKKIWWSKQEISDLYLRIHKIIQETQLLENTMCTASRIFLIKESDTLCEKHRSREKSVCVTLGVRQTLNSNPSSDLIAGPQARESKHT